MKEKYISLIKNIVLFAVGNVGSRLILFILVPLYTSYLSTAEYGISDLVFTVSQLLIPFFSVVIFDAVVRFGLSKEEKQENVLLVGLVVAMIGGVAMVLLTPLLNLYEVIAPWKWYVCVYVVFNMISSVEMNYLKSTDRNRLYVTISLVQTLLLAVLNILLLVAFKMGIRGYLISTVVSTAFSAGAAFVFGGLWKELRISKMDGGLAKRMLAFSSPLILNNLSWWALQSANKILIEQTLGAEDLGLYTVAVKIPSLINVIISIFSQAWNISAVKEIEGDNDSRFYTNVLKYYQFVVFGFAILLIGIMKPFMHVYVSDAYYDAWRIIPLLLAGAAFHAIAAYYASLHGAMKKSMYNMLETLLAAVVHVVMAALMIGKVGLWGAALATVSAYIVLMISRIAVLKKTNGVKTECGELFTNGILMLVQAVLVSTDYRVYLVSAVAMILFLILNRHVFVSFVCRLLEKGNRQ